MMSKYKIRFKRISTEERDFYVYANSEKEALEACKKQAEKAFFDKSTLEVKLEPIEISVTQDTYCFKIYKETVFQNGISTDIFTYTRVEGSVNENYCEHCVATEKEAVTFCDTHNKSLLKVLKENALKAFHAYDAMLEKFETN